MTNIPDDIMKRARDALMIAVSESLRHDAVRAIALAIPAERKSAYGRGKANGMEEAAKKVESLLIYGAAENITRSQILAAIRARGGE